jgi:hypothetical protein
MKRTRFSEGQIIGVLQEAGGAVSIREVCRKHGLTGTARTAPSIAEYFLGRGCAPSSSEIPQRSIPSFGHCECAIRNQRTTVRQAADELLKSLSASPPMN